MQEGLSRATAWPEPSGTGSLTVENTHAQKKAREGCQPGRPNLRNFPRAEAPASPPPQPGESRGGASRPHRPAGQAGNLYVSLRQTHGRSRSSLIRPGAGPLAGPRAEEEDGTAATCTPVRRPAPGPRRRLSPRVPTAPGPTSSRRFHSAKPSRTCWAPTRETHLASVAPGPIERVKPRDLPGSGQRAQHEEADPSALKEPRRCCCRRGVRGGGGVGGAGRQRPRPTQAARPAACWARKRLAGGRCEALMASGLTCDGYGRKQRPGTGTSFRALGSRLDGHSRPPGVCSAAPRPRRPPPEGRGAFKAKGPESRGDALPPPLRPPLTPQRKEAPRPAGT